MKNGIKYFVFNMKSILTNGKHLDTELRLNISKELENMFQEGGYNFEYNFFLYKIDS